ncbi:MAG: hypothetical protein KF758_16430 [Anaerolineales bacterium]|nr:hypothetical protein [Anaerolineales bacterium]
MDTIFSIALLVLSILELNKGIKIFTQKKPPLVLAAQIGFFIMRIFNVSEKYQKQQYENYKQNIKIYGLFTILSAILFIVISTNFLFFFIKCKETVY